MIETEALFRIGDAAEDAGDYGAALRAFERGAALGCDGCLSRLAHMHDCGTGTPVNKPLAMRIYRRLWRATRSTLAAGNLAVLYRELGKPRRMVDWYHRAAMAGDGDAQLDMAKCYLDGIGVKRDAGTAMRWLAMAEGSEFISDLGRTQARALIACLGPRAA
jgi:TPR repeat protein